MIYLVSVIFVFSVLVFFHELGHFLAAKLFGVRVERFSIGYPPRLFGIKIGETDYCVSAIPFGGYVKLSGMIDESMDTTITGEPYEFNSKPAWQKAIIISAGVFMNALLALIILVGLFWIRGEQIIPTTVVGVVESNSIAEKIGFHKYDEILDVNGQPVHSWNDVSRTLLHYLGNDIHFRIRRDGQLLDLMIAADSLTEKNLGKLGIGPFIPAKVGRIIPDYPAAKAGLQKGDQIIAINDQPITDWEDMTRIIRQSAGKKLELKVQRGSQVLTIPITPKPETEIDQEGNRQIVGKIGIVAAFFSERQKLNFLQSVHRGSQQFFLTIAMVFKSLGWLITGKRSPREVIGGPIMITKMAGDFAQAGFLSLLELIAYLSIMLAIINIFPLPVLDGGHLVIIGVEAIRGQPVSPKTKMRIQQIGMALILMLILFVIYNDIQRLFY